MATFSQYPNHVATDQAQKPNLIPQHALKSEKLDYFLFQRAESLAPLYEQTTYSIKERFVYDPNEPFIFPDECTLNRFEKEKIIKPGTDLGIVDSHSYAVVINKFHEEHKRVQGQHYVFSNYYDFLFPGDPDLNLVVSERLKQAMEESKITGFEFTDLGDRSIQFIDQSGI